MDGPDPKRTGARRAQTHNRGRTFPPDPPPVEDIVQVLNHCTPRAAGPTAEISAQRLRALIVLY